MFAKNLGHSASVADLEQRKIKVKTDSKTYNRQKYFDKLPKYPLD